MDISVIILSYNGKALLAQTLDAVKSAIDFGPEIEIIVADNGSTDGAVEMVKSEYPWVKLVENGANLGFSAGNNRGVKVSSGKYVLFLNSDTKLNSDSISYVYSRMLNDNTVGASTCRVELANGQIDPASHRGFPTPWRALCYYAGIEKLIRIIPSQAGLDVTLGKYFGGYHLTNLDLNSEHEIDSCTGAFMMIPREVGDTVGWWDEDYFMYGEDIDFCFRIKALGKKIMYFPQVKMLHLKHQSGLKKGEGQIKDEREKTEEIEKVRAIKRKTTNAFYDAMIIFYNKHYKDVYPDFVRQLAFKFINIKKQRALGKI
jgi:GT2 family glycosyltransferase